VIKEHLIFQPICDTEPFPFQDPASFRMYLCIFAAFPLHIHSRPYDSLWVVVRVWDSDWDWNWNWNWYSVSISTATLSCLLIASSHQCDSIKHLVCPHLGGVAGRGRTSSGQLIAHKYCDSRARHKAKFLDPGPQSFGEEGLTMPTYIYIHMYRRAAKMESYRLETPAICIMQIKCQRQFAAAISRLVRGSATRSPPWAFQPKTLSWAIHGEKTRLWSIIIWGLLCWA